MFLKIINSLLPVFTPVTRRINNYPSLSFNKICFQQIKNMSSPLGSVIDTDIDNGRFKYILIKVHHSPKEGTETSKFIVRGYASCEYHGDIYDRVAPLIQKSGLDCECLGGGRILHDADKKTIEVFGYSQGFGKADHKISVEILKKKYSDYKITWSDEGY